MGSSGCWQCFICGATLPRGRCGTHPPRGDFVSSAAQLLQVSAALIQGTEPFPFCLPCKKGIDQLLTLQKRLEQGLNEVKRKVQAAPVVVQGDGTITTFRSQVLSNRSHFWQRGQGQGHYGSQSQSYNNSNSAQEYLQNGTIPENMITVEVSGCIDEYIASPENDLVDNDEEWIPQNENNTTAHRKIDRIKRRVPILPPGEMKRRAKLRLSKPIEELPEAIVISEGHWVFEGYEIKKVEEGSGSLQCVSCGWKDNNDPSKPWMAMRAVKRHIKGRHLGDYKCPLCGKEMATSKTLEIHVRSFCPNNQEREMVICPVCGIQKSNKQRMDVHMWHHKSEEEKTQAIKRGEMPTAKAKKKVLKCQHCSKNLFIFRSNFKTHERRCPANPNRTKLQRNRRAKAETAGTLGYNEREKPCTTCTVCGNPWVSYIRAHMWTHKSQEEKDEAKRLGQKPTYQKGKLKKVLCQVCGKSCYSNDLKKHLEVHKAPGERTLFPCPHPECGVVLKSKLSLSVHLRNKHERPVKFECPHDSCGKVYWDKATFTKHLDWAHLKYEDRKFVCDVCLSRYVTNAALGKHKKTVHADPSKVFDKKCSICEERFSDERVKFKHETKIHGVKREKRVPNPELFLCDEPGCGKRLAKHALHLHKLSIHGKYEDRQYVCQVCNLRLITDAALKGHIQTVHSDPNKKFDNQCSVCTEKFSSDRMKKQHESRRHGIRGKDYGGRGKKRKAIEEKEAIIVENEEETFSYPPNRFRRIKMKPPAEKNDITMAIAIAMANPLAVESVEVKQDEEDVEEVEFEFGPLPQIHLKRLPEEIMDCSLNKIVTVEGDEGKVVLVKNREGGDGEIVVKMVNL